MKEGEQRSKERIPKVIVNLEQVKNQQRKGFLVKTGVIEHLKGR